MRISTGYQSQALSGRIMDAQSRVHESQQRVLTGRKFEASRENPSGTRMLLGVNGLKARLESMAGHYKTARLQASQAEESFSEIGTVLNQARSLGIKANSDSLDPSARTSLAKQVEDLKARLVSAGNVQDAEGRYLFSGQSTDTPALAQDSSGHVTYAGEDLPRMVEVKPGEFLRSNPPGSGALFEEIASALDSLKSDILHGKTTDSLAQVESLQPQLLEARGLNGSVLSRIEVLESQNKVRTDDLTAQASDIQEIDLAEAMTQYQSAQTSYEAALRVLASSNKLSLMDFIQ